MWLRTQTSFCPSRVPVLVSLIVFAAISLPMGAATAPKDVDLELVLAVDVSDSMSRSEMLVQRQGYIAALRSAEVAAAIAFRGKVALAYIEWAGPRSQKIVVPWTILWNPEDAAGFADALTAAPFDPGFSAPPWETGTAISEALFFAAAMFSADGASRIIDISGDGPQNNGRDLSAARDQVIAAGITINGLPIIIAPAAASYVLLDAYYEDCVIGGPGAFEIAIDDLLLFEVAIRRKLVLEIAGLPVRLMHAGYQSGEPPATDCAIFGQRPDR